MSKKKQELTVLPYTPRLRLEFRTMWRKSSGWIEEFSNTEGMDLEIADELMADYLMLSVRISNLNGDAGFELASLNDSPDALQSKFKAYMGTKDMTALRALEEKVKEADKPYNPETAPTGEGLDPEV